MTLTIKGVGKIRYIGPDPKVKMFDYNGLISRDPRRRRDEMRVALAHLCPHCRSPKDEVCRTKTGTVAKMPHRARFKVAQSAAFDMKLHAMVTAPMEINPDAFRLLAGINPS